MSKKFVNLAIYENSYNKKIKCISIDDSDGSGTRVTPSKGTGQWEQVATWKVQVSEIRDAINKNSFYDNE